MSHPRVPPFLAPHWVSPKSPANQLVASESTALPCASYRVSGPGDLLQHQGYKHQAHPHPQLTGRARRPGTKGKVCSIGLGPCSLTPHLSPGYRGDKAIQSSNHCPRMAEARKAPGGLNSSGRLCPGWPSPKQISNCSLPPGEGWSRARGSVRQPQSPGSSLCLNLRFCSNRARGSWASNLAFA